jgi:hypothetical protein
VDAYGPEVTKSLETFGSIMSSKMEAYKSDSQEVANALSSLIAMKDGTRPYYTVVNRIGEGTEQAFANTKQFYKDTFMKHLGWENF